MKKVIFGALLLGVSFITTNLVFADDAMQRGASTDVTMHQQARLDRMTKALALTSEQKNKIKKIMDDARPEMQKNINQIKEASAKIKSMLENPNYDKGAVKDLVKTKGDAITNLMLIKIETKSKIRDVLTPQQQAQWKAKAHAMNVKWQEIRDKMKSEEDYTND